MFNVENHQVFLSRFMSPQTPYKKFTLVSWCWYRKNMQPLPLQKVLKKFNNYSKKVKITRGPRNINYFNYPGVYIIAGPAIQKKFLEMSFIA